MTQEIMHQVALAPLLVTLLFRARSATSSEWLIVSALAVSWVADSIIVTSGSDHAVSRVYMIFPAIQFSLMMWAVSGTPRIANAGVVVLAFAAALQPSLAGYDVVLTVSCGFVVSLYAWYMVPSLTRTAILTYFGVGAIPWAAFAFLATSASTPAIVSWYAYQAVRFCGIGLFTASTLTQLRRPRLRLV